jgi:hypothetical protein
MYDFNISPTSEEIPLGPACSVYPKDVIHFDFTSLHII